MASPLAQISLAAIGQLEASPRGWYGGLMVRLAWSCAATFRGTDFLGGCDGARLRTDPEASWPENAQLDKALQLLEPIKVKAARGLHLLGILKVGPFRRVP